MKFRPDNTIKYEIGQLLGKCIYLGDVPIPENEKRKSRFGKFKCPCGKEFEQAITVIKNKSRRCAECNKANNDANRLAIGKSNFKHGFTNKGNKVYKLWLGIKDRCQNPNSEFYHLYGGRGIIFYEPWNADFLTFYKAVGDPPTPKHSFDRFPDNDGNYCPGNWRWATQTQQMRNTSKSIFVLYNNERWNLRDLCEHLGLNHQLVYERHITYKMKLEDAISKPKREGTLILNVETGIYYKSLPEAAHIYGIPRTTLRRYLDHPEKHKIPLIEV